MKGIIMTNQPQHNLKEEFKKWLEQQNYKPSVVRDYIYHIQHMVNDLAKSDWKDFSDNVVIPLLATFYEIANKEYYLDRVTAWYALDYFDKISQNMHNLGIYEPKTTLSIFDGKKYYYVCDITISKLNNILKNITYELYDYKIDVAYNSNILRMIQQEFSKFSPSLRKNLAIHITYDIKGNSQRKTALNRYCDFLYQETKNLNYLYSSNVLINQVQNKNPNNTIDGCFNETRPITGFSARQVEPNIKVRRDVDGEYVYSTADLAEIFNIDFDTASNLMNRFGSTFKIQTVLRSYYSAKATNVCLRRYHHYKNKKASEKYLNVNYNHSGYKWWCNRKEALDILGIKKAAFYSRIAKKNLCIDYAKKAPKYYIPELLYIRNTPEIRRIINRKIYNKQ